MQVKAIGWTRHISFFAIVCLCCLGLYACSATREAKANVVKTSTRFSTITFGQLKLQLPLSMMQSVVVRPASFNNLTIRSQTGRQPNIHMGTLNNFQDDIAQYASQRIVDESVTTFDAFFSELINLVGTRNYPKLQKIMGIETARSAKKYKRTNPTLYRFNFAKEKHIYFVFSNPKSVAEIYYMKGMISDADFNAIASGIRSR